MSAEGTWPFDNILTDFSLKTNKNQWTYKAWNEISQQSAPEARPLWPQLGDKTAEVGAEGCIDVPLRASPCMHPAQLPSKPKWGEAFIRRGEEVVWAARGGESMRFWLKPYSFYSPSHLHASVRGTAATLWYFLLSKPGLWTYDTVVRRLAKTYRI